MATQEDSTATTNGTIDTKIDTDHHHPLASDTSTSSVPPHHTNKLPSHLIDTPSKKRPRQDNFQYESDNETDNVNGSNDDRKPPQQISPTDLNIHDENEKTAENDDDKQQTTTTENGKEESEEKETKKLRMTTTSSDDGEQQQQAQQEQAQQAQEQDTQQQQQQPTSSSPLPSDSNEEETSTTTTTSVKIEESTSPTLTTATTTTAPNTNTNTIPQVSTPLSTPTPPSMMMMMTMNPPTALTPPTTTTTSSTLPSVPGLTPTPPSLASTLYSTPMVTPPPPPPPSQSSQQPLAPGTTTTTGSTPAHNNALLYAQQINQHQQHHQHHHHQNQHSQHHQQKQLSSTLTTPTGEVIDTSQMNHLCRVYIGNIHFELSQDDIRRTFSGFGTIVNMMTSKDPITQRHKGFCFIDYSTADSAQAAIDHMNGFQLAGRPLKLGRPKNEGKNAVPGMPILPLYYSPVPPPKLSQQRVREALEVAQSVATQINSQTAAGSANKVYVGSIHWDITEKELMTVFSACGTILSCHLSPNPETGKHRGYGFIEFATAEQAEEAIRRMNNFELAGRRLKVNRAVPGAASATMQLRQQQVQNVVASGSGGMGAGMGAMGGMGAYQQQQQHPYQAQQYMPQQQQQQQVPSYYGNAYAQQQMYYQPQQQPQAAYYQAPTAATTTMNIQPPTSSPYSAAAYGAAAAAPHYQSYYQQQQQQHSLSAEENFHIKGTSQRYMVMQQMMRQAPADESNTPSRCILLNNMVAPGGDKDPQLQNEVTTECSKHGYVEKVVIYALPSAVKIFVLFRDIESAHRAKTALDKRWFGGRLIDAQYYSTEKFNRGQFQ